MNLLRIHRTFLLVPSLCRTSILQRTSAQQAVAGKQIVQRSKSSFWRNFLLVNGVLGGSAVGYYSFFLTPKEKRQIKVTIEGIQRALRYTLTLNLEGKIELFFIDLDRFVLALLLLPITSIFSGKYQIHHLNMKHY